MIGRSVILGEEDDSAKVPIYQFRFLSSYFAKLVSENVSDSQQLKLLSDFKFDYQIAEEIIINGGIMEPNDIWKASKYLRSNWKFYKDPGFRTTVTVDHSLKGKTVPNIPYCSKKVSFRGQVYLHEGNIADIDKESLMVSKTHNYLLGECFSVDHENKKIYFWQSTCVDHPIKSTALSRVMNGLGMLDKKNEAAKYKLVIVLCTDWSRQTVHGSKFKVQNIEETKTKMKDKPKISFDDCTLQEWQGNDKTGMANKIETVIARVCYYPNLQDIVLQKV